MRKVVCGWIAHQKLGVDSALNPQGEEPASVAMGKLHSSGMYSDKQNDKALLSILYLQKDGKGCHYL